MERVYIQKLKFANQLMSSTDFVGVILQSFYCLISLFDNIDVNIFFYKFGPSLNKFDLG